MDFGEVFEVLGLFSCDFDASRRGSEASPGHFGACCTEVYAVEGNPEAAERAREAVADAADDVPEGVIEAAIPCRKWRKTWEKRRKTCRKWPQ